MSDGGFEVPAAEGAFELRVKNSRFLARVAFVGTAAAAKEEVRRRREEEPGARHLVFAFLLGPRNSEVSGLSDDGEPHGTGGRPVLEVLRGSGLRNALVTVVRYFGGTKLGMGGLSRAYAEAARAAIEATPRRVFRRTTAIRVRMPYALHALVRRRLEDLGAAVTHEGFAEGVDLDAEVAESELAGFLDALKGAVETGEIELEVR